MKLILVADDDNDIKHILMELLLEYGFNTILASNGQQAVNYVADIPNIALVILDRSMPIMNGIKAYHNIRLRKPTLPVIILSGDLSDENITTLIGDTDLYLVWKPFNANKLMGLVKKIIWRE